MTDIHSPEGDELSSQTGGAVSNLTWLIVCLLVVAVLCLMAAHAPPRIRLIGLFPAGLGLLIGWFVVWSIPQFNSNSSRRVVIVTAGLLAFAGWIGVTFETFRQEELLRKQLPSDPLAARMMKEFEQQAKGTELESPRPMFNSWGIGRVRGPSVSGSAN